MKYRIVERTAGDGSKLYEVQEKFLFFWTFRDGFYTNADTAESVLLNKTLPARVVKEGDTKNPKKGPYITVSDVAVKSAALMDEQEKESNTFAKAKSRKKKVK